MNLKIAFPYILRLQVFSAGAAVMALEILGSRLLAPYFGNTLFVWGSLIGAVLAGLSVGYYYGGKISDVKPDYATFSLIICLAGIYVLITTFTLGGIFEFVLLMRIGDRFGPLVATIIILGIPSILLGMVSPYAIKLSAKTLKRVGATAGNLYFVSTVGSIFGTFITAFFLIPEFGVTNILYGLSIMLIGISLVGLPLKWKTVAVVMLSIALALAASTPSYSEGVVYQRDTLYHRLIVVDNSVTGVRTLVLDDNFHSAMDLRNPQRVVFLYTGFFHLGFAINPNIKDVLFVGGGGFSGPKRFLADYSDITVEVVEIDEYVVKVAEDHFAVKPDRRLKINIEDGRTFLARSDKKYDLVVLDAYAKSYVPFHLMTSEFFELVNEHLTQDGVVVSNIITSIEGRTSNLFRAELKTLEPIFPNLYVFPVSNTDSGVVQNIIVAASKSNQQISSDEMIQNIEGIVIIDGSNDYVNHLYDQQIQTHDVPILSDDYAPVETLLNPLTGQKYVKEIVEGNNVITKESVRTNYSIETLSLNITATTLSISIAIIGLGLILSRKAKLW